MDRAIYTAMTGATAAVHRQALLSHNLANATTTGFRAELATFRSVPVQGDGSKTRVMALEATPGHLNTPGPAITTGNALDVMARGNAWFAVQTLDGQEAYTRNGKFEVTSEGNLVTPTGLPVLSDGGAPIQLPANAQVFVGQDGSITARTGSQPPQNVGRLKMVTPNADTPLKRGDDGLFRGPGGAPLENDANARLASGVLEGSNVNAVDTMVGIIAAARQFESQLRLMQMSEANDRSAAQLLGMN